ncbi:MAG: hypothetical protein GXP26_04285 [Planctomycetes bacterium]|nr:hypothetical protein [Planctomycetota bacterium]
MSYALSFTEQFYYPEDAEQVQTSERPTSVYQAVLSLRQEKLTEIAREVFYVDPQHLDVGMVMEKIRQTDTCTTLSPPVAVWIDEEGDFQVQVYGELLSPELSDS